MVKKIFLHVSNISLVVDIFNSEPRLPQQPPKLLWNNMARRTGRHSVKFKKNFVAVVFRVGRVAEEYLPSAVGTWSGRKHSRVISWIWVGICQALKLASSCAVAVFVEK